MVGREVAELISEHPFFVGIEPLLMKFVADCGRHFYAEKGEYLAHEGQAANGFFLIIHGFVAIETYLPGQGAMVIETLSDGGVAGWSWLVAPHRWTFDVKAIESTSYIELDGRCLRQQCELLPRLGYEVLKRFSVIMSERLKATRLRLLDLYSS